MTIGAYDSPVLEGLTWSSLESILQSLAMTPLQQLMVHHLVDGLRVQAHFLTRGGILRELSIITLAVTDQLYEEAPMSSSH